MSTRTSRQRRALVHLAKVKTVASTSEVYQDLVRMGYAKKLGLITAPGVKPRRTNSFRPGYTITDKGAEHAVGFNEDGSVKEITGMMHASAASTGGGSASTNSVIAKPTVPLMVPMRDKLTDVESMCLGFRMGMLEVGDSKDRGAVLTGSGCGSDFIILEWKGRTAILRGSEVLKAWVATFDPESAARMP
jgi:hypothetical protein